MDYLLRPVEWKTAGSSGELEGYASVFGNVDQGGDVVLPGAFRKTLADWSRARQPIPLIADHVLSTDGVIGSVHDAHEDGVGLRVKARFSSVPKAQEIRTKMIEGHLSGMSFTYEPVDSYPGKVDGRPVRYLKQLRLFEATITPFPMNALALASAKTADADLPESTRLEWAVFADAAAKALAIPVPEVAKAAMGLLMREYAPLIDGAVTVDGQDTPSAADDTPEDGADDTAPTDAASYAEQIRDAVALPTEPSDGALDIIATLETERVTADLDALEAQITEKLGRASHE